MFTSDKPALTVSRVAVAVVRGLTEHADLATVLQPAQNAVVGNVAPKQVASIAEPHRTFRPAATGVKTLDCGVPNNVLPESRVKNLNIRIGIAHWVFRLVTQGTRFSFERQCCGRTGGEVKEGASMHELSVLRPTAGMTARPIIVPLPKLPPRSEAKRIEFVKPPELRNPLPRWM